MPTALTSSTLVYAAISCFVGSMSVEGFVPRVSSNGALGGSNRTAVRAG